MTMIAGHSTPSDQCVCTPGVQQASTNILTRKVRDRLLVTDTRTQASWSYHHGSRLVTASYLLITPSHPPTPNTQGVPHLK